MSATKRAIPAAPPSHAVSTYLFVYNVASSVAWATILSRTILYAARDGFEGVYPAVGEFLRTTQAFACLELVHAATRLVRAPLFTTFIQLLARLFIVWVVTYAFPYLAKSPAYTFMLLAWSFTEVIRYSYFGAAVAGSPPNVLIWLRYTTFFVLYPVGMVTETWLVYSAVGPATEVKRVFGWVLCSLLPLYIPGFVILYSHMIRQRRKVLGKMRDESMKKD